MSALGRVFTRDTGAHLSSPIPPIFPGTNVLARGREWWARVMTFPRNGDRTVKPHLFSTLPALIRGTLVAEVGLAEALLKGGQRAAERFVLTTQGLEVRLVHRRARAQL